jgi:glutamyl-tRNA synthetase
MNGQWLRELPIEELTHRLEQYTGRAGLRPAVEIAGEKVQTLAEFWPLVSFMYDGPVDDPVAFDKTFSRNGALGNLRAAREALAAVDPFDLSGVEAALREVVERLDTSPGRVFQPVRVAITGTTVSPGIFESVAALGRQETLRRIDQTLERVH